MFKKLLKRKVRSSTSSSVERTPRKTPRASCDRDVAAARLKFQQVPDDMTAPGMVDDEHRTCLPTPPGAACALPRETLFSELPEEDEAMHMRWQKACGGRGVGELSHEELGKLLEFGGVPLKHRHMLWPRWFVELPATFDMQLLQGQVSDDTAQQIEADLLRTRPSQLGPIERLSLGRILRAVSAWNPAVGYCQGMNNIAAVFLLMGFDEVTSVRGCLTLLQRCCPGYHNCDLSGLRLDAQVLEALADQHLSAQEKRSLEHLGVPMEVLVSQHLLTLGSLAWSLPTTLRLWDLLLQEGSSAVFASVLAMFHLYLPGKQAAKDGSWKRHTSDSHDDDDDDDDMEPVEEFRQRCRKGPATSPDELLHKVRSLLPLLPTNSIAELRDRVAARKEVQ